MRVSTLASTSTERLHPNLDFENIKSDLTHLHFPPKWQSAADVGLCSVTQANKGPEQFSYD